jgi:hypothetical protein
VVCANDNNLLSRNTHTAQWGRVHQNLAEVKVQVPLEHTTSCKIQACEIVLASVAGINIQKIVLIFKCMCDSSTGHTEYRGPLVYRVIAIGP